MKNILYAPFVEEMKRTTANMYRQSTSAWHTARIF